MIVRDIEKPLLGLAELFPIITVTGPRQSGKTTLCRATFPDKLYVSLEHEPDREFARTDPSGFLAKYRAGAILDEVQRVPSLFSSLMLEVDRNPTPGRFVLTGSANFQLLQSITQSLAGRTALLTLYPLGLSEVRRFANAPADLFTTILYGSYPAVFDRGIPPSDWYSAYVSTYVERDVRQILNVTDLVVFQTYLRMCAGRTALLLNLMGLGSDCGISHGTARAWLSVLEASYIAHRLPPLLPNYTSRLVKAPKFHMIDSGLICFLLGIRTSEQLESHPLRGAIFESWAVAEVLKALANAGIRPTLSYYRDRKGTEVDLVVENGVELIAVETKSGRTVASDMLVSLEKFTQKIAESSPATTVRRVLISGGDERQDRAAATILPWFDCAGLRQILPSQVTPASAGTPPPRPGSSPPQG